MEENPKKKLWGGRFEKGPKEELIKFMSYEDVMLDEKLILHDIEGSLVHVCMLAKQNILKKNEAKEILLALGKLKLLTEKGKIKLDLNLEDVHTNIEAEVTKLTKYGMKMHTARSRNDQVALDTRMYMREEILKLADALIEIQKSLLQLAKKDCIFPSYTHFQVAQPVSLSFWCHAHWEEFERDLERLVMIYDRVNLSPIGSCAIAGTTWNIDREYTASLLGFAGVTKNPMDTVSSRGELEAELLFALYLAMAHACKISEDMILLSNKKLVILPDEYSTGSSIMPQKKNPDPFELLRGKTSRMLGFVVMAASLLKGVPTGYNKDSQESKFPLIFGIDAAIGSFSMLSKILPHIEFDEKRITLELEEGYACSTELADLFCKKGIPFRQAHEIVGNIVKDCISKNKFLSCLDANEVSKMSSIEISQKELYCAVQIDKKDRFSNEYIIPEISKKSKDFSERKMNLHLARQKLEFEIQKIVS